jgi:alpha-N-arabinofuranosidase
VKGDSVVPVTSDNGTTPWRAGSSRWNKISGIPPIDVVATRRADGKTVTLLCVNRSLDHDVPAMFDLGTVTIMFPATLHQIASTSRYERNDEVEPVHVVPTIGW